MPDTDTTPSGDRSSRRPGPTAADWTLRYTAGMTPWDLGRPHPELLHRMSDLGPAGRAVVPGAGRGHDAGALAAAGWTVTTIDLVADLSDLLRAAVGPAGDVVIGDVFEWMPSEPVDLIFDHTFFCAISPHRRADFGAWALRVLRPGGLVASVVFPLGKPRAAGGPPFGMDTGDLVAALPGFELVTDVPASHPVRRSWASRWAVFAAPGSAPAPAGQRLP